MGKLKKLLENHYLGAEHFNGKTETTVTFTSEPELTMTDYGEKYIVKVELGGKDLQWQMNATSSDYLDSQIKGDWKGQKATLVLTNQLVSGQMRTIIYAKGSF